MKKIIHLNLISLTLLLAFLLGSCLSISEEDQKIIDSIERKYGCEVNISKGASTSTKSGSKSYLELKCSNFQTDIPQALLASDIATICYNSIKSTNKYTHYFVVIENEKFEFSIDTLKIVYENMENNKQIVLLLQTERFDFVYERLSPIVKSEISKDKFISELKVQLKEKNYRYKNLGFEIINENIDGGNKEFIRFEGFYEGKNERILLKLVFNLENDHYLYGFQALPLKNK